MSEINAENNRYDLVRVNNVSLVISLCCIVVGMAMLAYASVPLYRLFCQVTGYGGTPTTSAEAPSRILTRSVNISFNADISPNLPWSFKPLQRNITLKVGERQLAFFEATNLSDQDIIGTSTFNVTPFKAGPYFVKLQCFCFEEQRINAGQSVTFPVSFYIDPDIAEDDALDDVKDITLSYTFFPLKNQTPLNKSES